MNVLESRFSLFVAFPRRQSRAKESLSCEIIATPSQANPDEIINVVSCRRAGRRARNTSALRLASFARVADGRGSRAFEATRRAWVQTRRGVAGLA